MAKIGVVTVIRYETSDGSLFESRQDAVYHEKKIMLGNLFSNATDPVIKGLSPEQCQAILKFLSHNLNSIITEMEISELA